ncbi:hypothetical protein [Paraburkholderia sp. GAS348]|uniref:hypothetical protein n=1 Tax=Paraburkholderia sp. GAS348 TaxID=3035132 RepID=UPI003D2209B0
MTSDFRTCGTAAAGPQAEAFQERGPRLSTALTASARDEAGMLATERRRTDLADDLHRSSGSRNRCTAPRFVQISHSHARFDKALSPGPASTPEEAVSEIQATPERKAFMIQASDISHPSKPGEFDGAVQMINGAGLGVHYVPCEHDTRRRNHGRHGPHIVKDRLGPAATGAWPHGQRFPGC